MMSDIIEGFELVFDNYIDKAQLIEFVEQHVSSISPKTRRVVKQFLARYR